MNLDVIPLLSDHISMMDFRPEDRKYLEFFHTSEGFHTYAMVDEEGIPVAIGGFAIPWPGVADALMAFSNRVEKDNDIAVKVFWKVKSEISKAFETYNLHRMGAITRCDDERKIRWMKNLGFEEEGIMRKFSPDKLDFIRLAKVI